MKLSLVLYFPVLVYAAPHEKRQLGNFLLDMLMPTTTTLKVEQLKPTIPLENVKRATYSYGPFKLRAANSTQRTGNSFSMDPAGTGYNHIVSDFPKDITVLWTETHLTYENGSPADVTNGVYNHHQYFSNLGKSSPGIVSCPNGWTPPSLGPSIFGGAAEEKSAFFFTSLDGKINSGYYIGKDDRINAVFDVVNYTNETKTVFMNYDMQYVQGKIPGAMESSLQVIAVGTCDNFLNQNVKPPPGQTKFSLKSKEMKFIKDGEVISYRGHLHDGGVNIVGKINGKVTCDSRAKYSKAKPSEGGMGHTHGGGMGKGGLWETIDETLPCHAATPVSKGDTFTIEAFYDLEAHPARPQVGGGEAEEMAMMTLFFAEKKS